MLRLAGYTLRGPMRVTAHTEIYSGVRDHDRLPVVAKLYTLEGATERAERERDFIERIAGRGLARAIAVEGIGERAVLVFERTRSETLARYFARRTVDVESFLAIAASASAALAEIHRARILHLDLNPRTIAVDPETLDVTILGLGHATELGARRMGDRGEPRAPLEGALAFVAPEQTGRMDRGVDVRSDLYSLGATLYTAWTGERPFDLDDPLELIHAHIARVPRPAHAIDPSIPVAIGRLLAKLLEKAPELRYQTAAGLRADLETALGSLRLSGAIPDDLALGTADAPDRLCRPPLLIGRERESAALRAQLARVRRGGVEIALLSGPAGIGKTAMASVFREPLASGGGYLARGAFERDTTDVPYAGVVAAFESFLDQLLTESDAELARWADALRTGLGNLAGPVIELVPRLGCIVGEVPAVQALSPERTAKRLALALRRFTGAIARTSQPLVLFLDDLHWADSATLEWIEALAVADRPEALLIVGTFRTDTTAAPATPEGASAHPLHDVLARLDAAKVARKTIELGPLSPEACNEIIATTLHRSADDTRALADRLCAKTGRNPFLIEQLLDHLHARGLLRAGGAGWDWDACAVEAAELPDDVVEILTAKIAQLPESARRRLEGASCIGDTFDLGSVVLLASRDDERSSAAILEDLGALVDAGLLAPDPRGFRFAHGRIREAAQRSLPAESRARLHYDAGWLLLARSRAEAAEPERADPVFEIAHHLNQARELLGPDDRVPAAEINLRAGRRAAAAGSISSARTYLDTARSLLEDEDWSTNRELVTCIYLESAAAECQVAAFDHAEQLFSWLEQRDLGPAEAAAISARRIPIRERTEGADASARRALAELRALGMRLPARPRRRRVERELRAMARQLERATDRDWAARDGAPDPPDAAALTILGALARPAFRTSARLEAVVALRLLRESLRLRLPLQAALSAYAVAQIAVRGDFMCAREAADLAATLDAGEPNPELRITTELNLHAFVYPWTRARREGLAPLRAVERDALEVGDPDSVNAARVHRIELMMLCGEPLRKVEAEWRDAAELARGTGAVELAGALDSLSIGARVLMDATRGPAPHTTLVDVEPEAADRASTGAPAWLRDVLAIHAMRTRFFLDRHAECFAVSQELAPTVADTSRGSPIFFDYVLYRGLAAAEMARTAHLRRERRAFTGALAASLAQMRAFARAGPDAEHAALLLEAHETALTGRPEAALLLCARAAQRAGERGHLHHAALAHRLRARIAAELDLEEDAARFLREALVRLQDWGAHAIAERLIDENTSLLRAFESTPALEAPASSERGMSSTATTTDRATTLDLSAVLRSAEAISGEVELESVVDRVMEIAVENAGAERAVLLLEQDGVASIEAEAQASSERLVLYDELSLEGGSELVPQNLIQYVRRTRRTVVLTDACSEGLFTEEPYVQRNRSRSILCSPILRQAKLVGVLYLENALVSGAFTEDRVEVLGLVSAHAAISLDNARLYGELTTLNRDLEDRVDERTEELRVARDAAQAATRAKSEFLAVMSHEIRTPMNVVIGMTQLLGDSELTTEQRECVQAVQTAGDSLLSVINDILDFSKIEAGKLDLEEIPFSLRDCLENVTEILAPKAQDAGLDLPVVVARDTPDRYLGDPARLKQIVINLVNNAIKFTERGRVSVRVYREQAGGLRFEVEDTGIGIPEERLDRLFQSFSQVDVSTTRRYGGTGLGLAISKRLVETMGGHIGVRSAVGVGSTFFFEVHLRPDPDGPRDVSLPAPSAAVEAVVLARDAGLAAPLVEQLWALGVPARAVADPSEPARRAEPRRAIFARLPLEDTAWETPLRQIAERGDDLLFVMPVLQERAGAREAWGERAVVLTRPLKRSQLHAALRDAIGGCDPERPEAGDASRTALRDARARFRILLAEDYVLNQKLAVRLLDKAGYRCDVVDDGQKAIDAVETGAYDLVLMDCQMPVVDGFEAAARIRALECASGRHTPIIAMTANAMKGERERCLAAGMDDYLPKPIPVAALYELIAKYLGEP